MKNDQKNSSKFYHLLEERTSHDIEAQISEASKLIADMHAIDNKTAYSKVAKKIDHCQKNVSFFNTLVRIAAALFLPALLTSLWLIYQPKTPVSSMPFAMQEISCPPGVRSKIVLPDGSDVWLNAGSTIKFRVPFDSHSRNVSLTGEAFFDVKKNLDAPFVVQSGIVRVKVYGTRFNCKAFSEENNIEVVLEEGKISLTINGQEKMIEKIMKPGDRAVIDKTDNQTKVTNEKIEKYIDWHNGKLVFDETPMHEVATQLARWYGIHVRIDDPGIMKYRITTTFDNESLQHVLELLKISSSIDIQYVPGTNDNNTQEQTKSKIVFSRKN